MRISRLFTCMALCVFLAGCGGGNGTATPDTPTELGDAETLGPAELIARELAQSGGGEDTAADATTIALSPDNTQIQFIGTHNRENLDPRTCEFTEFSGAATIDGDGNLVSVNVEIQTDSVSTFNEDLTTHLMNEDFLDVNVHPTIVFETTGIDVGDEGATLNGNLTLLGTTKAVSIPATVSVEDGKLSLTGSLTILRTEYGMDRLLDRVNDEVEINVTVEDAG